MDYFFVSPKGVFSRKELSDGEIEAALKVLVVYDSATRCVFAHAVPRKGPEPYAV